MLRDYLAGEATAGFCRKLRIQEEEATGESAATMLLFGDLAFGRPLPRIRTGRCVRSAPTYYSAATGTGASLKSQLNTIIKTGFTSLSYNSADTNLQITDADPNAPGHMLTAYDRTSVNVAAINPGGPIPGWDSGATWNKERGRRAAKSVVPVQITVTSLSCGRP